MKQLNVPLLMILEFLTFVYPCNSTCTKQQDVKLVTITKGLYQHNNMEENGRKVNQGVCKGSERGGILTPTKLYHGK